MRSLRIGVVLNNQLVEERVFTKGPITIGQSIHCSLSLPVDGMPASHVLFTQENGTFVLHPTPAMQGRMGNKHAIGPLAAGPVPTSARGKISLGETTILFQDIATLPAQPRAKLPASLRGTLADRIDRRLAIVVGCSLVAHIAIATWAWATDADTPAFGDSHAMADYQQDTIDVDLPDMVQNVTPARPAQPGTAAPVAPQIQTPHPIVPPAQITPTRPSPPSPPSRPSPPSIDDAKRIASVLASSDETPGATPSGMRTRQPGADLDKQLEDARHHQVAIGDPQHTSRVDDRAHIGTVPDSDLPIEQPQYNPNAPRDEAPDRGRIKISPPKTDDPTSLTPTAVLDKINNAYMTGLQRCYRKGLSLDASLSGKVAIDFTVDHNGRVTEPSATGSTAQVDGCVSSFMTTWHFPFPKDKDGQPTDASFHVILALEPN